jgi:hypothetical protein
VPVIVAVSRTVAVEAAAVEEHRVLGPITSVLRGEGNTADAARHQQAQHTGRDQRLRASATPCARFGRRRGT